MVKKPPTNAGVTGDAGSIPGSGRPPGGGYGNPLLYSCLENPTDRGAWRAIVHRVTKSHTHTHTHTHVTIYPTMILFAHPISALFFYLRVTVCRSWPSRTSFSSCSNTHHASLEEEKISEMTENVKWTLKNRKLLSRQYQRERKHAGKVYQC